MNDLKLVIEIASAIIAAVGGASILILSFSSWLGKVWADRILSKEKAQQASDLEEFKNRLLLQSEIHKIRLKKSEVIFAKEIEAASNLVALIRDILPSHTRPDMEWYDACDEIAANFGNIEYILKDFLRNHGAVLSNEIRKLISLSMGISGEHKFNNNSVEISTESNKAANDLCEYLMQAENLILDNIKSQITT